MYRRFYTSVDPIFLCRLYLSLVCTTLENACQVWDPYTQRNIKELESVQKFVLKVSSHSWNIDYETLLNIFQLPRQNWKYYNPYLDQAMATFLYLPAMYVVPKPLEEVKQVLKVLEQDSM